MADRIRRRITFANVISLLALFMALGGTVYATGVINGKTVKKESLPGNRLRPDSVTGKQVNEASLALPAASRAFTTSAKGPFAFTYGAASATLCCMPAGSYVVDAKLWVRQTQNADAHVHCNINAGPAGHDDFSEVALGPSGTGSDEALIALQFTYTSDIPTSAYLYCVQNGPGIEARDVRITAVQVADIVERPFWP